MKTLAELKRRIKLGTKIVKKDSRYLNEVGWTNKFDSTLFKVRTVDHVQGNAFTMDGSWLYWQPASDYEIDGDVFSVFYRGSEHTHNNLIGTYEIVH